MTTDTEGYALVGLADLLDKSIGFMTPVFVQSRQDVMSELISSIDTQCLFYQNISNGRISSFVTRPELPRRIFDLFGRSYDGPHFILAMKESLRNHCGKELYGIGCEKLFGFVFADGSIFSGRGTDLSYTLRANAANLPSDAFLLADVYEFLGDSKNLDIQLDEIRRILCSTVGEGSAKSWYELNCPYSNSSAESIIGIKDSELPIAIRVFISHSSDLGCVRQDSIYTQAITNAARDVGISVKDTIKILDGMIHDSKVDAVETDRCQLVVGIWGCQSATVKNRNARFLFLKNEFLCARNKGCSLFLFALDEDMENKSSGIKRRHAKDSENDETRSQILRLEAEGVTCLFFKTVEELYELAVRTLRSEIEGHYVHRVTSQSDEVAVSGGEPYGGCGGNIRQRRRWPGGSVVPSFGAIAVASVRRLLSEHGVRIIVGVFPYYIYALAIIIAVICTFWMLNELVFGDTGAY
jgi:hypothetical protein